MFFKRRSSRANSYVENDGNPRSQSFDDFSEKRPDSSRKDQPIQSQDQDDSDMYPRQQQPSQEQNFPVRGMSNSGHGGMPTMGAPVPTMSTIKPEPMPDLLAAAFNQAVRPYTEKIEQLESQLADMQSWVEQLEAQRAEVHSWIDKRGLRPDVPSSIAKIMDTTTPDAAHTLNAQLDRKITIVNFDLHRLQDDLNDSISSSHFASSMLKFLPDIQRLTLLPQGPKYAFDLILKLGGNLNSHGGLDSADSADIAARRDFYSRLDAAMVDVVQRRFGEGEEWNVQREIKRIEKTASYLKTYGVEPYFPQTREVMAREMEFQPNGVPNGQGTPPRASREERERPLPGHSGAACEERLSGGSVSPSQDEHVGGPVKRELVVRPILNILAFGRGKSTDLAKDKPMTQSERKWPLNVALSCRNKEKLLGPAEAYNFPVFDGMSTWSNSKVMIQQEPQSTAERKRGIFEHKDKSVAQEPTAINASNCGHTRAVMSSRRNLPKSSRAKSIKQVDRRLNTQKSWLRRHRKHMRSGSRIIKGLARSFFKSPTIKPPLSSAIEQFSEKQRVDSMQRTRSWVKAERWRCAPAPDKVDDAQFDIVGSAVARRRSPKFVSGSFSQSPPALRPFPGSGNDDSEPTLASEQNAAEDAQPTDPKILFGTDTGVSEGLTSNASSHTLAHIAPVTFTGSDGKAVTSLFGPFNPNGVMPTTVLNNESQHAPRTCGNAIPPSI